MRKTNLLTLVACVVLPAAPVLTSAAGPAVTDAGPTPPGAATQPAKPTPLTVLKRTRGADGAIVAELSNGLTAIVKTTRLAPVVCVRCYVRTGAMYEQEYLGAGISHLLEHLVAKDAVHDHGAGGGGDKQPKSDRMAEIGGQSNAYTSADETCYYIAAAASKAMDCIDVIGDWMANPSFTQADFRREHGVVQRELEMGKDEVGTRMWQAHASDFYGSHPAAVPVIGYKAALKALTYADVQKYHARTYVPQNMVFCVVGDIDAEAALERICRAMAPLPQARAPRRLLPAVAPISSSRRSVAGHKELKDVMARISFRTIPLVHKDLYALDVLSYVLSEGRASRLHEVVQRQKKLVTEIWSSSWTPDWGAGMFTIGYRCEPDKADAAEQAVLAELRRVVSRGVTAEELARAKRQKIADQVFSQQTAESQAQTLAADFMSTGDAWFSNLYTKRIQAVTAKQVRQMAAKYFAFDKVVITRLVPEKLLARAGTAAAAAKEAPHQLFRLPNGLRVVLWPTKSVPLVSMVFVSTGGVLAETPETNGLGTLAAQLSTRGAGTRSARDIATFFDAAGGSVAGQCGNNTLLWQATVLADRSDEALEIFADIVQRPTFQQAELDRLRPVQLKNIRGLDESVGPQLTRFWRGTFFGPRGYGLLPTGTEKVVRAATVDQIRAHHRRLVRAGSSVLAIAGRFDPAKVRRDVERLFADVPKGKTDLATPPGGKTPGKGLHTLKTDKPVAGVMLARPGTSRDQVGDRAATNVLDTIISGYRLPSGWLHTELRGKRLVYVVHAYTFGGMVPGAFVAEAICQPDKAGEVVGILKKNLRRAAGYKPTAKEVRLAVNTVLTAKLLENQSVSDLALSAGLDEVYGLGYDFRRRLEKVYRTITPEDVQRVAKKYFQGDWTVMVATPKPELLKGAEK